MFFYARNIVQEVWNKAAMAKWSVNGSMTFGNNILEVAIGLFTAGNI